jgi:hypothetical protein
MQNDMQRQKHGNISNTESIKMRIVMFLIDLLVGYKNLHLTTVVGPVYDFGMFF